MNGGEALCWRKNVAGSSVLTTDFCGSMCEVPTEFSSTVESNPKKEWSNGSDTRTIEAKLRRTKADLDWEEPTKHGGKRRGAGRPKDGYTNF